MPKRISERRVANLGRAERRIEGPLATQLAAWVSRLTFDDLPGDVVAATKLRVLDVIGLALAGSETPFGRSTRAAALALSPAGSITDLRHR